MAKVKTVVYHGPLADETARAAGWHVASSHDLESWGDYSDSAGTTGIRQPLIAPLYDGRNAAEVLGLLVDEEPKSAYDHLRDTLQPLAGSADFESFWREAIHRGSVPDTAFRSESPRVQAGWGARLASRIQSAGASGAEFEVVFRPDHTLWDGCYANNGWLQECPDPVTKLVWDNAAILAPATARKLGVDNGDALRIDTVASHWP